MAFENFTTYTEVDEHGDITVIATRTTWVTMDMDATSYVYKDYGVDFFGDFSHDIELEINATHNDGKVSGWGLANVIKDFDSILDDGDEAIVVPMISPSGNKRFYIQDIKTYNSDFVAVTVDTLYYCTVARSGTTATLHVYSDSDRLILVNSASITCTSDAFRYIYSCMSTDEESTGKESSGYSQNFDLGVIFATGSAIYFFDGVGKIELQRDDSSPVQMFNGVEIVGLKLGATNDANASPFHIYDGITIKAILKMP